MLSYAERLHVLSFIPGRIRLRLSGWNGDKAEWIEYRLHRINGVHSARANPLTGTILVQFDNRSRDADTVLAKLREVMDELANDDWHASAAESCMQQPANAGRSILRIGVRGLLGHAVVDSLWFGAGFVGSAMGLPLAGLGPLHVLMDIAVWTMALTGEQDRS